MTVQLAERRIFPAHRHSPFRNTERGTYLFRKISSINYGQSENQCQIHQTLPRDSLKKLKQTKSNEEFFAQLSEEMKAKTVVKEDIDTSGIFILDHLLITVEDTKIAASTAEIEVPEMEINN